MDQTEIQNPFCEIAVDVAKGTKHFSVRLPTAPQVATGKMISTKLVLSFLRHINKKHTRPAGQVFGKLLCQRNQSEESILLKWTPANTALMGQSNITSHCTSKSKDLFCIKGTKQIKSFREKSIIESFSINRISKVVFEVLDPLRIFDRHRWLRGCNLVETAETFFGFFLLRTGMCSLFGANMSYFLSNLQTPQKSYL